MKKKKFNIEILGCGRVAFHYYKIFKSKKIPNVSIVGVGNRNINKTKFFAIK